MVPERFVQLMIRINGMTRRVPEPAAALRQSVGPPKLLISGAFAAPSDAAPTARQESRERCTPRIDGGLDWPDYCCRILSTRIRGAWQSQA